jgi:hypothetical protein
MIDATRDARAQREDENSGKSSAHAAAVREAEELKGKKAALETWKTDSEMKERMREIERDTGGTHNMQADRFGRMGMNVGGGANSPQYGVMRRQLEIAMRQERIQDDMRRHLAILAEYRKQKKSLGLMDDSESGGEIE